MSDDATRYAYLGPTEIRRLAADAVKLAAAVKIWVPRSEARAQRIADRVIKRLTWQTFKQRRTR